MIRLYARKMNSGVNCTAAIVLASLFLLVSAHGPAFPSSASAQVSANADEVSRLLYMTEEYHPYNYTRNGSVEGVSVDILHEVWRRLGVESFPTVRVYPWARAYRMLGKREGTVLFSTARIPEREGLFQWAGPISTVRFVLIGLKHKNIRLSCMEDVQAYSVGTVRHDMT